MSSHHRLLIISMLLLVPTFAPAATWTVDGAGGGDFIQIQNAVVNAAPGDTIEVLPGIYSGRVTLDRAIVLGSTGGSGVTTILSAEPYQPVLEITADGATLEGFRLSCDYDGLEIASGLTDVAIDDVDVYFTIGYQLRLPPNLVEDVLPGVNLRPHLTGEKNAVIVVDGTITESTAWPALPSGFVYLLDWATVNVRGPSGPVLSIASGAVVKASFSRFEIGSASEPGGLVADSVIFTSLHDDTGGDTNGTTAAPSAGNWQRLDFNAMARADSCLLTNCEFRYGGNGVGVIQIDGSSPTVTGSTFSDNAGCLNVAAGTPVATQISGNVFEQGTHYPVHASLDQVDALVFGNTIVPRGDGAINAIGVKTSTIASSWTLPVLPHGFVYVLDWATISVRGASAPVLTIPSGTILKSVFATIDVGSAAEPGGLVAENVLFTSIYDDEGGDTANNTTVPQPGNWRRIAFHAAARPDSSILRDCTIRYGGNGGSGVLVDGSAPRLERTLVTQVAGAGVQVQGADAHPTLWGVELLDNTQYGLRTIAGQVHAVHCCFEGNADYGVLMEEEPPAAGAMLMTNCWWGAADGPAGVGPGTGDAVSPGVVFDPWATSRACDAPTAVEPETTRALALHPASPNPFNPSTVIAFELPRAAEIALDVVDLQGRRVAALVTGMTEAGRHEVVWRGRDDHGRAVGAGVYLVRLRTQEAVRAGKLILLK